MLAVTAMGGWRREPAAGIGLREVPAVLLGCRSRRRGHHVEQGRSIVSEHCGRRCVKVTWFNHSASKEAGC